MDEEQKKENMEKTVIVTGAIAELVATYYGVLRNLGMRNEDALYLTSEFQSHFLNTMGSTK